jgi:hypothetical protein
MELDNVPVNTTEYRIGDFEEEERWRLRGNIKITKRILLGHVKIYQYIQRNIGNINKKMNSRKQL